MKLLQDTRIRVSVVWLTMTLQTRFFVDYSVVIHLATPTGDTS